MLILVAVGVASADIIKIKTDLHFDVTDIQLWYYDWFNYSYEYKPLFIDFGDYNSDTKELRVDSDWVYKIEINGITPLSRFPGRISKSGIDMRNYDYYVIEKYFDVFPEDPGTPITQ